MNKIVVSPIKEILTKLGFTLLVLVISLSVQAKVVGAEVAKTILLKGDVYETYRDYHGVEQKVKLSRGDNVHEGSTVTCEKGSFAKLLFFDKSQMMISPGSSIEIKSFTKERAGMISLLKGKIRSKVTKDRMNIENSKTSKLFIKTKTAAMGVRGTDFQVIYNPSNNVTSLLTFEGAVAMTQLDEKMDSNKLSQRNLEARLNSMNAVMVRRGQFSGTTPGRDRVSLPVKISPAQLEVLRGSDGVSQNNSKSNSNNKEEGRPSQEKVTRSIVPPGLDAKKVATNKDNIIESVARNRLGFDKSEFKDASLDLDAGYYEKVDSDVPPEGVMDTKTGAYAPAAGGFLDSETGLYIPPGKGDAFDSNANVYVPSSEIGSIDPISGDYIAPEGTKLTASGELVKTVNSGRGIASVGTNVKQTVIKNVIQNNFNTPKIDTAVIDQSTGSKVDTSINFNDYKTETVINYNDNTNLLDKKTREIQRRKIKINIVR